MVKWNSRCYFRFYSILNAKCSSPLTRAISLSVKRCKFHHRLSCVMFLPSFQTRYSSSVKRIHNWANVECENENKIELLRFQLLPFFTIWIQQSVVIQCSLRIIIMQTSEILTKMLTFKTQAHARTKKKLSMKSTIENCESGHELRSLFVLNFYFITFFTFESRRKRGDAGLKDWRPSGAATMIVKRQLDFQGGLRGWKEKW